MVSILFHGQLFTIHPVAYFLLAMHIGVFLGALSSLLRPVLQSPLENGSVDIQAQFQLTLFMYDLGGHLMCDMEGCVCIRYTIAIVAEEVVG